MSWQCRVARLRSARLGEALAAGCAMTGHIGCEDLADHAHIAASQLRRIHGGTGEIAAQTGEVLFGLLRLPADLVCRPLAIVRFQEGAGALRPAAGKAAARPATSDDRVAIPPAQQRTR